MVFPVISYNLYLDLAVGLAFVLVILFAIATGKWGNINKELFLTGLAFGLIYVIGPTEGAVSQSASLDRRIIVPAVVLLILGSNIRVSKTMGRFVIVFLLLLSVLRTGTVWQFWNRASHEIELQVNLFKVFPLGAKVYPVLMLNKANLGRWLWDMNFQHSIHYATIQRQTFSPSIYTHLSAPLRVKEEERGYWEIEPGKPLGGVDWNQIFSKYDYLWCYQLTEEYKHYFSTRSELVGQSGEAMIFRINNL